MLRFSALMEHELTARGHLVTLLQPQSYLGRIRCVGPSLRKWLGYADKFVIFPRKLKSIRKDFDVIHICDHSNAMYTRYLADVPHLVTCHDVLAIRSALGEIPQNLVSRTGKKFQSMILAGLKAARMIVCVSENTRTELLRVTGCDSRKVLVTYLSLNYPYSPMERETALVRLDKLGFDARRPYLIHVGGTVWYKNKLGVLEIFDRLRKLVAPASVRLLMVGKPLSSSLLDYIREHELEGLIDRYSEVSNEDLRAAYSLSQGLIFPSLQEGFGWPVLEAQACGCPVFTTARAPMTEVGGRGAVYLDPSDTAGAAKIIVDGLRRCDAIRLAGLENIQRFGVEQMIQGYLNAYRKLMHLSIDEVNLVEI
jgi:glycosyltransferase involved in cell wall biosynthesis